MYFYSQYKDYCHTSKQFKHNFCRQLLFIFFSQFVGVASFHTATTGKQIKPNLMTANTEDKCISKPPSVLL